MKMEFCRRKLSFHHERNR